MVQEFIKKVETKKIIPKKKPEFIEEPMVWISNITRQYAITMNFTKKMTLPKDIYHNSSQYFELTLYKA